jgi:hypothetical protein
MPCDFDKKLRTNANDFIGLSLMRTGEVCGRVFTPV